MKIIELLSPKGNSIIKVPGYCKNLLIKNNYKSLPKNTFLKKIKIFLYLKFLSRIRSIFFLLSKIKIKFKNPPQKQVIIFDKEGSENLKPILKKDKYYILKTRLEHIDYIYLTPNIVLNFLRNFFNKSLKLNYLCSIIEIINPKIIITEIDTSVDFFKVSEIFSKKGVKTIAVQGTQKYDDDIPENFYIENYFTIGDFEKSELKRYLINTKRTESIGSLRAVVAKNFLKSNKVSFEKIYDICLISEPHTELNTDGFRRTSNPEELIAKVAEFTIKFCKENNKKLIFNGKAKANNFKKETEKLFYQENLSHKNFEIKFSSEGEYGTYKNIAQSDLIIALSSTCLRESFAFDRKILCCNFGNNEDAKFPGIGPHIFNDNNYDDFEKRVFTLLSMNYEQYISNIQNLSEIYNKNIDTIKFLQKEINK